MAHPGQSYHPDDEQHRRVVNEAVDIELKREEVKSNNRTPLTTGITKETLELLVSSDDDSEEEVEDFNNDYNNSIVKPLKKGIN